jgi:nucleoside-diphosphate-sugar epimerase
LWLLKVVASIGGLGERMTGRAMPLTRAGLDKLTGNAWFASDKIRRKLGFAPQYRLGEEIPLLVEAYRRRQARGESQSGLG